MKKLLSCILAAAIIVAGSVFCFAASDIVFEKDATLQNLRNFFNNVTIKKGVTLTTKSIGNDPQGIEISGLLSVEEGAKIVGSGVIIFYEGSGCSGMNLYYKTKDAYKILPEDGLNKIFTELYLYMY